MNLVESVVAAWKAGYRIFYPAMAKVMLVKSYIPQTPASDGPRGLFSATTGPEGPDQETVETIGWTFPGKPAIGARFLLLRMDNLDGRKVAVGFSKYDEIKTTVGQATEVEINDQWALVRNGEMEMSLDFTTKIATIRNGTNQMQATSAGWTIDGPVTFTGPASFQQNVEVDLDLIVDAKGTKVSSLHHGHGTAIGPTTGKIPNGE